MNWFFSYCIGKTDLNELFTDKKMGESLTRKKRIGRCVIILPIVLLLLSFLIVSLHPLSNPVKITIIIIIIVFQPSSFYVNFVERTTASTHIYKEMLSLSKVICC